ncbi:uncharacterized protein LOC131847770 [Achroia grisella]|uniref:uncharacterized protein LOC131847770 n=1 Tax=Achroia grisella TaxID=688607 RepID=UPI0027D2CC28|nr:uncharacterized protein LOC131847770 [Achroia grisella]
MSLIKHIFIWMTVSSLFLGSLGDEENVASASPPHCTVITKATDYAYKYRFDYPLMYIPSGQPEAYQKMYCIYPPTVNKASATVCDWAAPPQVQFTLGDDYLHVVRQDPTGKFLGNALITTYQFCSHNISHVQTVEEVANSI